MYISVNVSFTSIQHQGLLYIKIYTALRNIFSLPEVIVPTMLLMPKTALRLLRLHSWE